MKRISLALAVALTGLLLLALPAAAADLTGGCRLEARSFDANRQAVDEGVAPGPKGSQDDPFRVDWDGFVDFLFVTPVVFQNNHWDVRVYGLPVLSGRDDNPSDTDETGTVEIFSAVPVRVVGLFHVEGDIYGNGDTDHCHGDGWVYVIGDPIGTVPWVIAAALIAAGLLFLVATPYSVTWETDPTGGEVLRSGAVGPGGPGGAKPQAGKPQARWPDDQPPPDASAL